MESFLRNVVDFLIVRRKYLFIGMLLITAGLTLTFGNLKIENALEVWFLKDDPTLHNYNEFKRIYGSDEVIAVWVKPDTTIYEKEFVSRIYTISNSMLQNPLIRRVLSITKAPYMDGAHNELTVEDLVNKAPDDSFAPDVLKRRLENTPLWHTLFLDKDGSSIVVLVEPKDSQDMDARRPEILKFVGDSFKGMTYKMAGLGVVYNELNRISLRDASTFTLLSFILLVLAIWILFRNRHVLYASLITMFVCTLLFVGIFCLFGQKFNMISAILPSLIVILCLEDVIYIFATYFETSPGPNRLRESLRHIIVPCFFTSLTTAIGFFSFSFSSMAILKSFGIYASIGVMIEYFVAVAVSVFILAIIDRRDPGAAAHSSLETARGGAVHSLLTWINEFVFRNHRGVAAVALAVFAVGVFFASWIKVDTYTIEFLLDSNQVKRDSAFFEKEYGFYVPLEVRLKPTGPDGVKSPAFLRKLDELQTRLAKDSQISRPTSIVDIVKQLNRVLTDGKESSYRVPDDQKAVAQELLLYEMDDNNDLAHFVDTGYTEARLTLRVPMVSSQVGKKIMERVEKEVGLVYGKEAQATFGGYIPLYVKLLEYIAESQVESFLLAFFLIFISTGLLFRSLRLFLITVAVNIVPIACTLGIMGIVGVDLDVATVTIAALTIGLSVDNTIQYLYTCGRKLEGGMAENEAIRESLLTTGKPMFISNAILVIGYCVMAFSSVKSVIYFGVLIAATMLFAVICDLFLLPSLLLLFRRSR